LNAIKIANGAVEIDRFLCNNCGKCSEICYPQAIRLLGKPVTVDELLGEIMKDTVIFKHSQGGVTISGGEPLLYPDFNRELLQRLKEEGVNVGVDTCGYVPWVNIEAVLEYVDFFLWDIKHMNSEIHKQLTGVENELILTNARLASDLKAPIYIRIPLIPGFNDSEENIRATCEFARSLPSLVEISLIPFHHLGKARYDSLGRIYKIDNLASISEDTLKNAELIIGSYGIDCTIVT
jgi:pyruvate formate lyase activating enzyme